MWLKLPSRNHTEGMISAEAAVCSAAVILLFALFITIAGYCRSYSAVKQFADKKARDVTLLCHAAQIDLPGIIPASELNSTGQIKNLIVYHEGWGDETRVYASYTYASLLGNFRVRLSSVFTKWDGDAPQDFRSVWELPPNERGRKIEEIFGGGLPEFFPVLDAYDLVSGHAASIVSMDTTLGKYHDGKMIKEVLYTKIDELTAFDYGKSGDVIITGMDIDSREQIIVIPENVLNVEQESAFAECSEYAWRKGIILTLKRYQTVRGAAGPVPGDIE